MADAAGIKRRTNVMAYIPFKLPDTIENVTFDISPAATDKQLVAYVRQSDGTTKMYKCDTIPEFNTTTITFTFTEIA